MRNKVIVTAAITGSIHTPSMSPYLPITPKQIADEAVRSWEAGAAVCHIHMRNHETGMPPPDLELFRETLESIKSRCDAVVCVSTGGGLGMSSEQQLKPVSVFRLRAGQPGRGAKNSGAEGRRQGRILEF